MDFSLGVLVFVAYVAAAEAPRDGGHVRTMEARLRTEIDEGMARSPLFRHVVSQIDASDVIVYVETECPMRPSLFGRLAFMGTGGGRRYLNVRISCSLSDNERIAALGHELRHAVEIADAPSVVDVMSLATEYKRIGFGSRSAPQGTGFESRAAIDAARRVWADLMVTAE